MASKSSNVKWHGKGVLAYTHRVTSTWQALNGGVTNPALLRQVPSGGVTEGERESCPELEGKLLREI